MLVTYKTFGMMHMMMDMMSLAMDMMSMMMPWCHTRKTMS